MMFAVNHRVPRSTSPVLLAALLMCALLTACKFPTDSGAAAVGSKGLWIANGTNVVEYIPSQLGGGTNATVPHLVIGSAVFGSPRGVTFDAAGNLWVLDPTGVVNGKALPALFEFSAAQVAGLASDNAPDPVVTITSSALTSPQQSVFDVAGNQWVSDHNSNTIVVFAATQLAQAGASNVAPAMLLSSPAFNGPLGIAFDGGGDLWVANNGGVPGTTGTNSSAGTTLVAFAAANLPALPDGGELMQSLLADVTLSDDGQSSIQAPWALAFDSAGNLWSSNANSPFTLNEFAAASLAATGNPMPATIISPASVGGDPSLDAPNGLCFDDVGNLVAANSAGAFAVALFGQNQLTTGAPMPDTFIVGAATTLNAPAGCRFGPVAN